MLIETHSNCQVPVTNALCLYSVLGINSVQSSRVMLESVETQLEEGTAALPAVLADTDLQLL